MTTWRLMTADGVDARDGLAMDEALMLHHGRSESASPPILRLYTYRDHAALCGRYQHLEAEIDLAACRAGGTTFNRRPTGGGAIVMGSGQLGVAVLTRSPASKSPKALLIELSKGIVTALASVGIGADFGGKNDLKVNGRKIAGLGLYVDAEGGLLFHASILADLDIPFMLEALNIPASKLGDQAVTAVESRVTTVTRETGRLWTGADFRPIVREGFRATLGIDFVEDEPSDDEMARAHELVASKYSQDEWIHARSPQADATATSMIRTPHGTVRVYLALQGDTIKSVLVTGDVNTIPEQIKDFESRLKWARLSGESVARASDAAFPTGTGLDVDPHVLVDAVLEAGSRATRREIVAPHRLGSCYFPDESIQAQKVEAV